MTRLSRAVSRALKRLSAESQATFRDLIAEYGIRDRGGQEVLLSGLRSLEMAVQHETQIATEGATLRDRFGQLRAHPLLPASRDCRAAWQTALRQLNLSIGEPAKVGRPEGV